MDDVQIWFDANLDVISLVYCEIMKNNESVIFIAGFGYFV